MAGHYEVSVEAAKQSLSLDPDSLRAHAMLGASLEQLGKFDEAIAVYKDAFRLSFEPSLMMGALGHTLAKAGRTHEATALLGRLRKRRRRRFFMAEALIQVALGDTSGCLTSLEKAYEEREFTLVMLRADPRYAPLRPEPRFRAILRRIGLG